MSVGLPDFLTELLEGLRGPFSPVTAAGPGGTTTAAKTVLHLPEGITAPYVPGQVKRAGAIADQRSGTKRSTILRATPTSAQTPTSASPATSTGATSTDPTTGVDYGDPTTDGTSVALPAAAQATTGPSPVLLIGLAAIAGLGVWFFVRRKKN